MDLVIHMDWIEMEMAWLARVCVEEEQSFASRVQTLANPAFPPIASSTSSATSACTYIQSTT